MDNLVEFKLDWIDFMWEIPQVAQMFFVFGGGGGGLEPWTCELIFHILSTQSTVLVV